MSEHTCVYRQLLSKNATHLSLSLRGKVVLLRNVHQLDKVTWQRRPHMTWIEVQTFKKSEERPFFCFLLLIVFFYGERIEPPRAELT